MPSGKPPATDVEARLTRPAPEGQIPSFPVANAERGVRGLAPVGAECRIAS
jgi:hypothetical protein